MNILLNGVGRIGKAILRIANQNNNLNIVAINELNDDIDNIIYTINYDSTYGQFKYKYKRYKKRYIQNNRFCIKILHKRKLDKINFSKYKIDTIIDASGSNVDISLLKTLNIKNIFLTHPNKQADINLILGVNENQYNSKIHKVISTSSCNATALMPLLNFININYDIKTGDILTIHPLLNHQKVLDSTCISSKNRKVKCNFEFGRSSITNMIPSKTTTIDACSYINNQINSKLISSSSIRVSTDTVGAINVTLYLKKQIDKQSFISLCKKYQKNQKYNILLNNFEPLVSSDFKACSFTTIIDHRFTQIINNKMLKLLLWYDNEWGYASKVLDIVEFTKKER